jgi:ATP-dependent Clp protease ATP-binding subunit ClpC
MDLPQVKLFMQKANIATSDVPLKDIAKDVLSQSAFETSQTFKGKFVTTLDVFVAYLLLIEDEDRILFAKQLKTLDVYNILFWVRMQYPYEETPKKLQVHFWGGGIGDAFVSGWTPETAKYTTNFTSLAIEKEPLIRGREGEFKAILESFMKAENNNVLLIGDAGAGKENLVRSVAHHSFMGNLGKYLNYKRVFLLMVGALTAGASSRSDLELRLQNIIAELSHANDVILYIPDFQNIIGGSAYNLDLSGALLPYLKNGSMPIIASMTIGNFKTYMAKNALREAFTIIQLNEPKNETALQMVLGEAERIEDRYGVILSYRAISSSVELADRFFPDDVLPGSAVLLLENVANTVALSADHPFFEKTRRKMVIDDDVVRKVEETKHVAIGTPTDAEIELLLHLEDKLHERVIAQGEAVKAVAEAMRRVRSGMLNSERPTSFLFLGPTGVGKTETAKTLAEIYYGGEDTMIRLDMSEYTDEDGVRRLLGAPPGEGSEAGELTDKVHDHPSALLLLDEFEKANPKIHNLFLQVLDDGRLTDNKGNTVSFRNSIIIATSNAGSEFIRQELAKAAEEGKKDGLAARKFDKEFHKKLLDHLQTQNIFKPELLNRFDAVITFKPLGPEEMSVVTKLMLDNLAKNMQEQDIALQFDDAVIEKICQEGFDQEFGARPLRRYIQDTVEDLIAQKKLSKELDRGKTGTFSLDGTGALILSVS